MKRKFEDVIYGKGAKGVDDYFLGKDDEGIFVARLRLEKGKKLLACIDIERTSGTGTSFFYSKCFRFLPFISRWIGRIKAKGFFDVFKSEREIGRAEFKNAFLGDNRSKYQ